MLRNGYFPATLRWNKAMVSVAWVQLLTDDQLALIRKSERGYHLVQLGTDCAVRVNDSEEILHGCYAFWHPRVLTWPNTLPPILAASVDEDNPPIETDRGRAKNEAQLLMALAVLHFPGQPLDDAQNPSEELVRMAGGREELNNLLRGAYVSENDPTPEMGQIVSPANSDTWPPKVEPATYGTQSYEFAAEDAGEPLRVFETGPVRAPKGKRQPLVYLAPAIVEKRKIQTYCFVKKRQPDGTQTGVVARVVPDRKLFRERVRLDQMLRDAVGVSIGERCSVFRIETSL